MSETGFPLSIVNVTDCLVTGEFLRADIVFVADQAGVRRLDRPDR